MTRSINPGVRLCPKSDTRLGGRGIAFDITCQGRQRLARLEAVGLAD
jgi:hypothetical protein